MKYIVMADGKGTRWNNYMGVPKHFIQINGETLLRRMVRLIKECEEDAEVIITSHDPRYEVEGASRYEPQDNNLEIDRFTYELIEDDICFLYGDTYYTKETIKKIIETPVRNLLFFGNEKSIVAVKIKDGELFRSHVDRVKRLFLEGKIETCIGWQVYQSAVGLTVSKEKVIGDDFIKVDGVTKDFNSPADLEKFFV